MNIGTVRIISFIGNIYIRTFFTVYTKERDVDESRVCTKRVIQID